MRHMRTCKSDDDLNPMRGIGLAVVVGLMLWVATSVAVSVSTRSPQLDILVSNPSLCSDVVSGDHLTSYCDPFTAP